MKTDMKKTQENNGKKCAKMEYLDIEIFNHFLKAYTYIIWNKKHLLGEIAEDDILKLLDKIQLIDFYHIGKTKFKVEKSKVEKYIKRDDK